MLNIDLFRVDEPAPPDHDLLLATVHIAGEWTGSVVLALSQPVAIESAAAMLHIDCRGRHATDQHDVASELVNMIGGNLKSLLPGPSLLVVADDRVRAAISACKCMTPNCWTMSCWRANSVCWERGSTGRPPLRNSAIQVQAISRGVVESNQI